VNVTHLFAGVPVVDLERSLEFYERLTGRPPDGRPNESEAVWQLADGGLVYVVRDRARAGRGLVTLIVDDLEAALAELAERGVSVGPVVEIPGGARKATVVDPDGNEIGVGAVG
jgi:predicted enzyme related to lactoylglutathione lyase